MPALNAVLFPVSIDRTRESARSASLEASPVAAAMHQLAGCLWRAIALAACALPTEGRGMEGCV